MSSAGRTSGIAARNLRPHLSKVREETRSLERLYGSQSYGQMPETTNTVSDIRRHRSPPGSLVGSQLTYATTQPYDGTARAVYLSVPAPFGSSYANYATQQSRNYLSSRPRQVIEESWQPENYPDTHLEQLQQELIEELLDRSQGALNSGYPTAHPIEELTLPQKLVHPRAGYIGSENRAQPKWLWDSLTKRTVRATNAILAQGYVALSYTWGRWREGWLTFAGTPWNVPSIRPDKRNPDYPHLECKFNIAEVMEILGRMPNTRYFWIDVLCINQDPKTEEQKQGKAQEIAKQDAIFKNAKGVLVYLWSLDNGTVLKSAINDLRRMMRWYWQINVAQDYAVASRSNDQDPYDAGSGNVLRIDPWFSSLWTLQEMVLAPASVWMARDGSHCQMDGQVLTTHTVANKFQDFVLRGKAYNRLEPASFDPSRNFISPHISHREGESRRIMELWKKWAFKETSITACLTDTRSGVLLATGQRRYTGRRELAVLGALNVGNDERYDQDSNTVDHIPVTLYNTLIQAEPQEGGRLFDNAHSPNGPPLTSIFPTTAESVSSFHGIRETCAGWIVTDNRETVIPRGSNICRPAPGAQTEYQFHKMICPGEQGDPESVVRTYLSSYEITVEHVRFLITAYEPNYRPTFVREGEWESTGVRGIILVTESEDLHADTCRWYKAGMFYSKNFQRGISDHTIVVGKEYVRM